MDSRVQKLPKDVINIIKDFVCFQPKDTRQLNKAVFSWCEDKVAALQKYGNISIWNTSLITSMEDTFCTCFYSNSFNDDISHWDVSNVTNMKNTFTGCEKFNQSLNNWDVSKVEDMSCMFENCTNFNQPLNNWNVSNVKHMNKMFRKC